MDLPRHCTPVAHKKTQPTEILDNYYMCTRIVHVLLATGVCYSVMCIVYMYTVRAILSVVFIIK